MSVSKIKKDIKDMENKDKAKIMQGFFKTGKGQYGEGDVFLGLTMPQQRKIAKKYTHLSIKQIEELLHSKIHEHRMIALVIWTYQYQNANKKDDNETKKEIYNAYMRNTKWINNWDLVDVTTPHIVGMHLLDRPKDRKILYEMAKSKDLWEKRISVLATFAFINHGKESKDTLKISEMLLNDDHDLIHKAVGWMLREVGKRISQEHEEKFLDKYHKTMPRTMLRYAIERFSDKKKKHYMKK